MHYTARVIILGTLVVIAVIGISLHRGQLSKEDIHYEVVRQQTLQKTVSGTATVVPFGKQTLQFEMGGVVQSIKVGRGRVVQKGDELASITNKVERGLLQQAKAKLALARTAYSKLLEGSGNKEIIAARAAVEAAKKNLVTVTKAQQELTALARKKLYSTDLQAVPSGSSKGTVGMSGTYTSSEEGEYTITIGQNTKEYTFSGLERGTGMIDKDPKPLGTRGLMIAFPDASYAASEWKISIPNRSSEEYESNVRAYQSALNTMNTAIAAAKRRITAAETNLNVKRATVRQADIDQALANIVIAEDAVDRASAELEKTISRAPNNGTILDILVNVGAEVTDATTVFIMKDSTMPYVEAQIQSVLIDIGQRVTATFTTGETYHGTVTAVDQGTGLISIKPDTAIDQAVGVTGTIKIIIAEIENALVLPQSAIETTNGISTVLRVVDVRRNETMVQPVEIGVIGDGDLVEIKGGLTAGDRVLVK